MVVGSTARSLLGEVVEPNDLDVVVADDADNRRRMLDALIRLGARVETPAGWRPLTRWRRLPWQWSWTAHTRFGTVDVVGHFTDGTSYPDVVRRARVVDQPLAVLCHPTRHAA